METQNAIYSQIYKIFLSFSEAKSELASLPWLKLEPAILEEAALKYMKEVKQLG